MKAVIGFESAYNGKKMDFLLTATLPNEFSKYHLISEHAIQIF